LHEDVVVRPTRDERFERLFRANYAAIRGYALRRVPGDVAQDVVADTFLVAWRRLDDVPEDALPWLYGVARRVLANERRSADRRSSLDERVATAAVTVASADAADSVGEGELLRAALAGLSDAHREALMLVAWHGLSGARAARAAGCTPATFAVRLHRARGKLAARLASLEQAAPGLTETESLEVT
jgi:RNA polymerase sigma-70 factor, ECF subfamily